MTSKDEILNEIAVEGLFLDNKGFNVEETGYDLNPILSRAVNIYLNGIPEVVPSVDEVKNAVLNYRQRQVDVEIRSLSAGISNFFDATEYVQKVRDSLAIVYDLGRKYSLNIPNKEGTNAIIKKGLIETIGRGKPYLALISSLNKEYGLVISETEIDNAKGRLLDKWTTDLAEKGFEINRLALRKPKAYAEKQILDNVGNPEYASRLFKAHGVLLDTCAVLENGRKLIAGIDEYARSQDSYEVEGYIIGDFDGTTAIIKKILLGEHSRKAEQGDLTKYILLPECKEIEMESISDVLQNLNILDGLGERINLDDMQNLPQEVRDLLPEKIEYSTPFVPIKNKIIGSMHTHPRYGGMMPSAQDAEAKTINNITELLHSQGYPSLNMLSYWDENFNINEFKPEDVCFFTFIGRTHLENSNVITDKINALNMRKTYGQWLKKYVPVYLGSGGCNGVVNGVMESVIIEGF